MTNLTEAQLAALPYAETPEAAGITSEDYREQFGQHCERIRHFACFPNAPEEMVGPNSETVERDGNLYVESELGESVRVAISSTERAVFDAEFGLISQGQTSIACLPDEVELARGDRVILIDRRVLARKAFIPSGEHRDELDYFRAVELLSVSEGEATLEVEDDGRSFVRWIGAPPLLCRITYRRHPQFVFLDISDKTPPFGSDEKRLPQRGILTLENRKS